MFIIKCGNVYLAAGQVSARTPFIESAKRFNSIPKARAEMTNIRKKDNSDLVIIPVPDNDKEIRDAIGGKFRRTASLKDPPKAGIKYIGK